MEWILFAALAVLGVMLWRLSRRVERLELALRERDDHDYAAERPRERERPVARVAHGAQAAAAPTAVEQQAPLSVPPVAPPPRLAIEPSPPEAAPPPEPRESLGGLFERLVGGRLLIWIGGIALALAGLFLVRYSIQIGLITPALRMVMAAAFGLLLIGAGEIARRRKDAALDPRVAQALVGAGVLILYAAAYGSHVLYGLLGIRAASGAMLAITFAALGLSLRHGAPAAVMGLIGGFLTPVLVGNPSESSVPLLTYLFLLNAAVFALASRRGWTWLAASAVLLSFGWTGLLIFLPPGQALPAGVFILLLSVAASMLRAGGGWHLQFLRPAAIGLVELGVLVARTDLGVPAWALFAALAAASFFLAGRAEEYRPVPALAIGLALGLLFLEAAPPEPYPLLPWIAAGITLIFAGGAAPGALRGRSRLLATSLFCAAFAGPVLILRFVEPALLGRAAWGALFALLAAAPALLAWRRGGEAGRGDADRPLLLAAATALLLLGLAAWDLLPRDLVGSCWVSLALLAAFAARRFADRGVAGLALAAAIAATMWAVAIVPELWATAAASLEGDPALVTSLPSPLRALLVLGLPVPLLLLVARVAPATNHWARPVPLAVAALFAGACAYVLFKQLFGLGSAADFVASGFAERTLLNQALFVLGWLICSGRIPLPGATADTRRALGLGLTALAAARLVLFDLLLHNPFLVDQNVGALPVLNLLLPAYGLSAFWLYKARRAAVGSPRSGLWLGLLLAALIAGTMLMVRQGFHGGILAGLAIGEGESYGYSLAGLLLSIALLLGGIRLPDKALRLAGLVLLTATICKVFLADAAALQGLLRILSFMGLGIALIGIGKLYGTVLRAEAPGRGGEAPARTG
ncbi:MAG TPA: DUF2339 domain-containing protein [Allosphingosinicella sp.]|jgi:uncharacterized membrane protein